MSTASKRTYKAVPFGAVFGPNCPMRYCIVDIGTGEIVDDAHGCGYLSPQKAYAAWSYKSRDRIKESEDAEKLQAAKQWLKEHPDFVTVMDSAAFDIVRSNWGQGDKFDTALVAELLEDEGLNPPVSAGELLRAWKNH